MTTQGIRLCQVVVLTELFLGAVLLAGLGMGALTACSPNEKEAPKTTTTTPSPSVVPPPTDKAVGPGGPNSFSPTVNPAPPGTVCKEIVGSTCVR
jgi:hypothetical protein